MAILKLLSITLLLALITTAFVAADSRPNEKNEVCADPSFSIQTELSELKSKVQELESMVEASKAKEIAQDSSWLPSSLAKRITQGQIFMESSWKLHGKPAMEWAVEKAMEKKTEAEKLAQPHIETIKNVEIRSSIGSVISPPIVKVIPSLKALCSWMETFAESKPQSKTEHVLEHQE